MSGFLEVTIGKFIFKVAGDRLYTPEGMWAKEEQGLIRVGLSDFLQQRSGDVAFVEVKPAGVQLSAGDEAATIETIKVNITLASPAVGTVVHTNPQLAAAPEIINQDPYGAGWLCEIRPANWQADRARLLTPETYFEKMKRQAEEESGR